MERGLIISSTEKSVAFFREMLGHAGIRDLTVVSSAGEARRRMLEYEYDICVINAPCRTNTGRGSAAALPCTPPAR